MNKSAIYKPLFVAFCLWFALAPTFAQTSVNLLTNPGFEDNFIRFDGEQPRQVATGWTPWHTPRTSNQRDYENLPPKYEPVAPNTARIRSGQNAQQYYSFFATHEGGIYQQVRNITPNTELRFSIYAYVWSSTYTDPNLSEDDGNVLVSVGIDPTGGTNPSSSAIQWSVPFEAYDAYRQYSVIATAQNSTVTVYVRSTVGEPVWNSYIYLDDAVLEITTGSPTDGGIIIPTATATVTASPTETEAALRPTDTSTLPPTATNTTTATATATIPPTNTPTENVTPTQENLDDLAPTLIPQNPTATPTLTATLSGQVPTATAIITATPLPDIGGRTPISEEFPGQIFHVVRQGDTVLEIATLYGSSVNAIIQANGLNENALIRVEQRLIVPVRLPDPATETPSPTPEIGLLPTVAVEGSGGGPGGASTYIVQPGDTLLAIAQRFNTTVGTLAQLNGIVNINRIQVGQRLIIPGIGTGGPIAVPTTPANTAQRLPPLVHRVDVGENLYRISLRYNVSMRRIAEANNIVNYNLVFAGQTLVIPR